MKQFTNKKGSLSIWFYILFITAIISIGIFGNNIFGANAAQKKYEIPNPHYKIIQSDEYPTSCNIYIASDGLFYYEYPGYHINNFGEKTVEEAFLAAKSWVKWKMEKDSKTYNLIDTYNFN